MHNHPLACCRLKKAPVIYVVAEVLISPVMKMAEYVADIQDRLRQNGFPKLEKQSSQKIEFNPISQKVTVDEQVAWEFISTNGKWGVVLTPSSIAVNTSQHQSFNLLSEKLSNVLKTVNEVVGIAASERLGLRYVDLIRAGHENDLNAFLTPGLHGVPEEKVGLDGARLGWHIYGTTTVGHLVIRANQFNDGTFFPPDMRAVSLVFDDSIKPPQKEKVLLLDFDHSHTESTEFDVTSIIQKMKVLHDGIWKAFLATVSERAIELWEPETEEVV